ncbi:hypothetical protein HDE_03600 [Halotydeus destructor]|nr:hypothetical protein HDE_03600 [Halotydeus destructor]
MKVYVLRFPGSKPWDLSRMTLIYGSYRPIGSRENGVVVWILYQNLRSTRLPAPYDTDCHSYDRYLCIYDCTQVTRTWQSCSDACSKQGCNTEHSFTLGHTTYEDVNSSRIVLEQNVQVQHIVSEAKMEFGFIVLNVLGLLGAFFGISLLSVTTVAWQLTTLRWAKVGKILTLACYVCAVTHCCHLVGDHLKYLHVTEVYQGNKHVKIPKVQFSVCAGDVSHVKPWSKMAESQPPFQREVEELLISNKIATKLISLIGKQLIKYEKSYVSKYSVGGKFCYLFSTPISRRGDRYVDLLLPPYTQVQMVINFFTFDIKHISVHAHENDIMDENTKFRLHMHNTLQNTYTETTMST